MKAFQFSLQSVLDWQNRKVEVERQELERMHGAQREIRSRREAIQTEIVQLRDTLANTRLVASHELAQIASYERTLQTRGAQMHAEEISWDTRIEVQRVKCMETDRHLRMLEKCRSRRMDDWRRALDVETENAAAGTYLAKWVRDSRT